MITYYIQQEDKIVLYDTDLKRLKDTLLFTPQYNDLEILETENVIINGVIMTQGEYENYQTQQERQKLDLLNLTAADVERAIYKAKGIDFDDIITLVQNNPEVDLKALKIELKANNFYRGNPYISQIGTLLGFSESQLDEFFETNDYTKLIGDNNA